jgi:hypothetical protein
VKKRENILGMGVELLLGEGISIFLGRRGGKLNVI